MHIISKQGSTDNVLTYEHICDTSADMAKIDRKYITLGSVCIILAGESGAMEVYMADSNKEWHDILAGASSGSSTPSGLTLHICAQNEVSNGKPNIEFPLETVLYLVPSGAETGNLYDEYIWVNNAWELFGGAKVNLTGYATQEWVSQQGYLTNHQDISALALKSEIPTQVSALQNDSGYLTSFTETDPTVPAWAKASQKPTYTAQEVGALPADTQIPTVPTNISAFTNDANYLSNPEATTMVENWLESNITSGNVIDASLTIEGAGADAKKTGDEISNLKSAIGEETKEEIIPVPVVTGESHGSNNVTDNGDGTFSIGTASYGSVFFNSPFYLIAGEYELFGCPNGFTFINVGQDHNNPIVKNESSAAKRITIENNGLYYIGHRTPRIPSEEFMLVPSLKKIVHSDVAHKSDLTEWVDILKNKAPGAGTTDTTNGYEYNSADGTYTIKTGDYGTIILGDAIELQAGIYILSPASARLNDSMFVSESRYYGDPRLFENKYSFPIYIELTENKTVYVGFRNNAAPDTNYTLTPYLKKLAYKFVDNSVIDALSSKVDATSVKADEAKAIAGGFENKFAINTVEHVGYNLYANGEGDLVGPVERTTRGYTEPSEIPVDSVHIVRGANVTNVWMHERINGHFWIETTAQAQSVSEFDHTFRSDADMWFIEFGYSSSAAPVEGEMATVTANFVTVHNKTRKAKDYLHDIYRHQADILRRQKYGSEGNSECAFKAMLVSDVHMETQRMQNVVDLMNDWGAKYFDALINCGDTLNVTSNEIAWYNNIVSNSPVVHLNTVGNHDISGNDVVTYQKIIAPVVAQTGIVQPENAEANSLCYYYYDFTHVRVIVLNDQRWNESQATWFASVLDDARQQGLYVIACSHYHFNSDVSTHIKCNWSIVDSYSQSRNIQMAMKVKDFIDAGGTFICWLSGHEHGDNLHVLHDYGNQLVVTLPTLTQRAVTLYPNSDKEAYNYDVMTYFVVDDHMHYIKILRFGADIDMYGVKKSGVVLNYQTGELVASF